MFLLAIATAAPDRFAGLLRVLQQIDGDANFGQLESAWAPAAMPDRSGDGCLKALAVVQSAITIAQLQEQAPTVARFSFCEEEWFRVEPREAPSLGTRSLEQLQTKRAGRTRVAQGKVSKGGRLRRRLPA
jgi:hypothetical protein